MTSATRSPRRSSGGSKSSSASRVSLPRWVAPAAVLVILAVQPVLDGLDYDTQFLLTGIFDWTGHLATGVVLIAALRPPRPMAAAILVFSVVIDVDHLPAKAGIDVLTTSTARPVTHCLLSVLVLLAAAGLARSGVLLGCAIGLAGHLFRDIGTGDAGVPLLWPLSDGAAVVPFWLYVALLVLISGRSAARPTARRTRPR